MPHHVHVSHLNPASGWRQHPAQHPNRGGFARAIRAQQAKYFAGLDGDVNMIDRDEIAEAAGQVFGQNDRRGASLPAPKIWR
jgi:hypothetical protein